MKKIDTEAAAEQYGAMVYRLAYAQLRTRHDADDVFQEVFLRYHRSAPPFESEAHRRAWPLRVTANCAKSLAASPALIQATLAKTQRFPLRRLAAIAAAAAVLLATPALAAQTESGYQLLYAVFPAAAQFFQPVRQSCTDNGVTMEVAAVRIEGDTAQAYITLSGEAVDGGCDLFDSYNFHLPFDQTGACELVGYDGETHTAASLCTARTMDGSPIPTGGKMTFSVGCFLTGKTVQEDVEIPLNPADYPGEAAAMAPDADGFSFTGGSYSGERNRTLLKSTRVLVPGEALTAPAEGLTITAAGFVDGLFHVQLCRGDATQLDNHGWLYLADDAGNCIQPLYTAGFTAGPNTANRQDYQDFVFAIPREAHHTLLGDFSTTSCRIDGSWRVTFPLRDTFSDAELAEVAEGHSTGSFDPQDTLLTFASRLEAETGRSIRWEDGFRYEHLLKTDRLWAAEFRCPDGGALRIYLQNIPYEDTSGLWQPYAYGWQD